MKALSQKVEQSLIFKIRKQERVAGEEGHLVRCDDYLNLANLYEMEHDYEQEVDILERFLNLGLSDEADRELVETQCGRAKILRHQQRLKDQSDKDAKKKADPMKNIPAELKLEKAVPKNDGETTITRLNAAESNQVITKTPTVVGNKLSEPTAIKKIVIVCSTYTGKTTYDEIFQLGLVGVDYCENNHAVVKITKKYEGKRYPTKPIPEKFLTPLTESPAELKKCRLDNEQIQRMLNDADAVISHNDPFIERQHLLMLFPEFDKKPWYSSQLDIPWPAIGFTSRTLPDLLAKYQLPSRLKTPLERASGIARLLSQFEPETDSTFFDRLLKCHPMKPFEWTEALQNHSKKLNKKSFKLPFFK